MGKRMKGSVVVYRGLYLVRLRVDGARKSFGSYKTLAEAEDILAGLIEATSGRSWLSLSTYGPKWLDAREADGVMLGARKERSRWNTWVASAPFYDLPLKRLKRLHFVEWVKELCRAKSKRTGERLERTSISNCLNLVRSCLTDAVESGHLESNPAREVKVPKMGDKEEKWTYLTPEEIEAVVSSPHIPEPARLIYTVAIYTGLRAGELWGLRWKDVVLKSDTPHLKVCRSFEHTPKSKKIRIVPLLGPAKVALARWSELQPGVGNALVWPAEERNCHSGGYDAGWADRKYGKRKVGKGHKTKAGILRDVRFHDLRHTCGSHLVIGTWGRRYNLLEVRDWLGHSTIKMTERYAHLAEGGLLDAAKETVVK